MEDSAVKQIDALKWQTLGFSVFFTVIATKLALKPHINVFLVLIPWDRDDSYDKSDHRIWSISTEFL